MSKYMENVYGDCTDKELLKEGLEVINSLYEDNRLPEDLIKYADIISSLHKLLNYGATRKISDEVIKNELDKNDKLYKDLSDL